MTKDEVMISCIYQHTPVELQIIVTTCLVSRQPYYKNNMDHILLLRG